MKKLLLGLLALAFVVAPLGALASSGTVAKQTVRYYSNKVDNCVTNRNLVLTKANKIDAALLVVKTTPKNLTKLQKLNVKLDLALSQSEFQINKARTTIGSKTSLNKAELNSVKNAVKLAEKLNASAKTKEKELRRKIINLGTTP